MKEKILIIPFQLNSKGNLENIKLEDKNKPICIDYNPDNYRNNYEVVNDYLKSNFKDDYDYKDNIQYFGTLNIDDVTYYNYYIDIGDLVEIDDTYVNVEELIKSDNPFILSFILKYFTVNYKNLFIN